MTLPYPLRAEGFKEVQLELRHADEERHPEDIVHCGCLEKGKEKHQGKVAQFNQFPYEILESDGNVTLTTNEEKGKRQVTVRGTATRLQFRFKAFSTCPNSKLTYKIIVSREGAGPFIFLSTGIIQKAGPRLREVAPAAKGSQDAGITQPRAHSFAIHVQSPSKRVFLVA